MLISSCISDQSNLNYHGQVIDTSHSIIDNLDTSNGQPNRPTDINTDQNGNPTVVEEDNTDNDINEDQNHVYPTLYTSTKTKSFKKTCDSGLDSLPVSYTVTVNSLISQNDADTKALVKLDLEGKANAEAIGVCQCALIWVEPTLSYVGQTVKVRLVINNATEYRINQEDWQTGNEFIITQDGEYTFSARKGLDCVVSKLINIRTNPENDIFNIKFIGFTCDSNSPNEATITDIKFVGTGCDSPNNQGIYNIRRIQEGCTVGEAADITNIKRITQSCK